jgi:hypothetical protein
VEPHLLARYDAEDVFVRRKDGKDGVVDVEGVEGQNSDDGAGGGEDEFRKSEIKAKMKTWPDEERTLDLRQTVSGVKIWRRNPEITWCEMDSSWKEVGKGGRSVSRKTDSATFQGNPKGSPE